MCADGQKMAMKTRRSLRFLWSVLAMANCATTTSLQATTLLRLNLAQLAQAADAVALARCDNISTYMQQGNVWTRTEFTVLESLKGSPPQHISVHLPGGRFGHLVVSIEAVPRFRSGETGVLFLQKLDGGGYSIAGWALGSFRVHTNERTGETTVTQDSSSLALFDPVSRRFVREGIRGLPLNQFRQRLAVALSRGAPEAAQR
jgi:hypothetical protein